MRMGKFVQSVIKIENKIENSIENFICGDRPSIVNKSLQENTGQGSGVQGAANMCKSLCSTLLRLWQDGPWRHAYKSTKNDRGPKGPAPGTTDGLDGSDTEPDGAGPPTSVQVEDDDFQKPDWFEPGMYIKIFAPDEKEINEIEFIILDSRNMAGKAVRVDQLSLNKLKSGSARNAVAVMGPLPGNSDEETRHTSRSIKTSGASTKVTQIFLEALGSGCDPPVDRYARLDHTYNIPFSGHRCQDLGVIDSSSLRRLRIQYINYLASTWGIEDDVGKQSNSSKSPTSSRASVHTSGSGSGRKTS